MKNTVLPSLLKTLLPSEMHDLCVGTLYKKNQRLFLTGAKPQWMFFVVTGEVTLERTGLQGEPVVMQRTRLGFVSEASLKVAKYHCDAVAITDTTVIKVPSIDLALVLDRDPAFASRWINMLNAEVKRLRLHCERLSMKSAKDRVLHLINTEGIDGKYQVNTGLKSLSGELGITHEALYRTLALLEKNKIIKRNQEFLMMSSDHDCPVKSQTIKTDYR